MHPETLKKSLRFYFITDDGAAIPPVRQVEAAISGGATMVQYRNKSFTPDLFEELEAIRRICRSNGVPFVVNDDPILAKAAGADGVHLGQTDGSPDVARTILGDFAIVGVSVSTPEELRKTDLQWCDYIGTGPVFGTTTKKDPKPTIGIEGLKEVVARSSLPVVAIGGVTPGNARSCIDAGAAGVAVISSVTRSKDPFQSACALARACGTEVRGKTGAPWNDEFGLIEKIKDTILSRKSADSLLEVGIGDDAALLKPLNGPVVTTDTQAEGVHFRLDWQTPQEVGRKAVAVTLSDLAASYARPVALFVNLSLPSDMPESSALELFAGIESEAFLYGCAIGGGNICSGTRLEINIFALGELLSRFYPARSNAKAGYELYCTGYLGLARAGLLALQDGIPGFDELTSAFKFPRARFDAASVLLEQGIPAVIDISDGLVGDATHLARESGVTIRFDVEQSAYSPHLLDFCKKTGIDAAQIFFAGGEDYELLFACAPETARLVRKKLPVYRLGECLEYDGAYLQNVPPGAMSFQHGACGT